MSSIPHTSVNESQREASKAERRQRILDCAREILRQQGHAKLSIRPLADAAGVTTPTIYNLIGNKHQILLALAEDSIRQLEQAHESSTTTDPIAKAEEVVNKLVSIYQADEEYSRQLHLGLEAEALGEYESNQRGRGRKVAIDDCKTALEHGYLNGDIDSELLGNRFSSSFHHAQRSWLRGKVDLEGMRREALISCFIILAADARPRFRQRLFDAIRDLG